MTKMFGYQPRFHALEDAQGEIVAAWPLMLIRSRLTGTRLVCIPFCFRAGPLISTANEASQLFPEVLKDAADCKADWIEVRGWPSDLAVPHPLRAGSFYVRHTLDLSSGVEGVLAGLKKDMRYSIRRAERNGLSVRSGSGPADRAIFYNLYVDQRRRQGLLPQPEKFINAIWDAMEDLGGFAAIVEHGSQPACVMLSIGHGSTIVGMYSGTDIIARKVRAVPLAIWKSVELACQAGYTSYDFGRSDVDADGLQRFKADWGASSERLPYLFYPNPRGINSGDQPGIARSLLRLNARFAPDILFKGVGSLAYPHLG